MIKSMTGFGQRQGLWSDGTASVEVRSVNHRFLETSIRLPKSMSGLEKASRRRSNNIVYVEGLISQCCYKGVGEVLA